MTHASYWTEGDGTRLHYRYDDFTDPWKSAPERCAADALAFARKHFPEGGR